MAVAAPIESGAHRPRNVDWKRAAALLYGDWGTSKAYVLGLAFLASGFSSLPIILAVCVLTGLVGINYAISDFRLAILTSGRCKLPFDSRAIWKWHSPSLRLPGDSSESLNR